MGLPESGKETQSAPAADYFEMHALCTIQSLE